MRFTLQCGELEINTCLLQTSSPSQAMGVSFPVFIPRVWQRAQYICLVTMFLALGDDCRDGKVVVTVVLSGRSYLYLAIWISFKSGCLFHIFVYFLGKAVNVFTVILLRRLRKK